MQQIELEVALRNETGKGAAHRIRREGLIPAVLYGPKMETWALAVDPKELKKILSSGARGNTRIDLKVKGPGSEKIGPKVVMLKELQIDPISRSYLHADFYAVSMDEKITVDIPIRLTGKAEGVKSGGILEQPRRDVRVRCLPGNIPDFIEVDVSALNIGDSLHVKDIAVLEKFELLAETNFTVASVTPPISEAKYDQIVAAPGGEEAVVQPERIGEKKEEEKEEGEPKEKKEKGEPKEKKE